MNNGTIFEPWNLQVLRHAIDRYKERSCGDKISDGKVANILRNIVSNGKEMILKSKIEEVKQMLKHDCKLARYFKDGSFMVVVEDRNIITAHTAEAGKWREKPKA